MILLPPLTNALIARRRMSAPRAIWTSDRSRNSRNPLISLVSHGRQLERASPTCRFVTLIAKSHTRPSVTLGAQQTPSVMGDAGDHLRAGPERVARAAPTGNMANRDPTSDRPDDLVLHFSARTAD
jgi:hypothetical protein